MANDLLDKLINKINFQYANNFELAMAKEYSFVPINVQGESFFVAVSPDADKEKIIEYIQPIVNKKVEFIFLSRSNFETLFENFLRKFSSKFGGVLSDETSLGNFGGESSQADNEDDEDIIIEDDEDDEDDEDIVFEDDEAEDTLDINSNTINQQEESVDLSLGNTNDMAVDLNADNIELDVSNGGQAQPQKNTELRIGRLHEELENKDFFGVANVKDLERGNINSVEAPMTKKIGEILIEEKLITNQQLTLALAESKALSIPLGSVLVKMGFITIKELKEALGAQMGVTLATTEQLRALPTAISVLPEDFVRENKVIPLSMTDKSLVVGMVDPADSKTINEIVYQTGLKPTVIMVTHYEYESFVQTYYEGERVEANKMLKEIENEKTEAAESQSDLWEQVESEIQDTSSSVAKLANKILTMAIEQRASDIHVEPRLVGYVVRYRIDGTLNEVLKIPQKVDSAVVSRYKVLARMNIAEHRRAQDGNFSIKYNKKHYDFRVNTLPVGGREKMVIRILAPAITTDTSKTKKIEIAGASEEDLKKIKYLVSSPNGIVLTSGPTGSGKTTTLYALIKSLNSVDVNITTIEDPVEIKLDGVNQSAVNVKADITFASCMRAILRQDPDIILVGEIRDYETLEVAISASLTGHLVLSTVHTNSAAATVTRLIEMGAKDYLISSTLSGVIAQRLVKKLCPECREPYKPTYEEASKILNNPDEIKKLTETTIYRAKGCPFCNNTGYSGRTGVFEIMLINKDIKMMIARNAHDVELEEYAIKHGMKTLKMSCFEHILNGVTTIDEFVRVLGLASED